MPQELETLPSSRSEYFKDSDVELIQLAPKAPCDHLFMYQSSREVECKRCHAGYVLGPVDELRDNHIYHNGQFVI